MDAHATDIIIIDVSKACNWAETLVLGTCASRGQASAAAGAILHHVQQTEFEVCMLTNKCPCVSSLAVADDMMGGSDLDCDQPTSGRMDRSRTISSPPLRASEDKTTGCSSTAGL